MASSKKHHYIPQFYLEGFANEDGDYFVFDKKKEEIRKSNPINSFYENHRNSSITKNSKVTFLENIYAHFDSVTSIELEKIRKSTIDNFDLEPKVLHRMKMFITQMYWRIPANDDKFEQLVENLSFKEIGLDFKDKITGHSLATAEFQKNIKSIDVFHKMYRVFIPLISANEKYKTTDFENWRVYFRKDKFHLTGDNPIVIKKFVDFSSLNGELLFPLSSDKLFIHTKQPKPTTLPSSFLVELDILMLLQATRFVCCPSRRYLEFLVKEVYPSFKKDYSTEELKNVYSIILYESKILKLLSLLWPKPPRFTEN